MRIQFAARAVLAAGAVLCAAPALYAGEAVAGGEKAESERKLDEALAEIDSLRARMHDLEARLAAPAPQEGGIGEVVKQYLESEEGKKSLGRGKEDFRVFWKEGLKFETADKDFSLHVGGRVMYDVIFPDEDSDLDQTPGFTGANEFVRTNRFRRARVELDGTIYKNVYYAFHVELASTPHTLADAFIGVSGVPVLGSVQVGNMKEPFSLDQLTSAKYITFMERSSLDEAFVRGRNPGLMVFNGALDERLNWAVGIFGDDDGRGTGLVGNNITARVTGTPYYEDKGTRLLHLGLGVQRRDPESGTDQIRSRPEISIGGRTVDSGVFSVEDSLTVGLETAYVHGPFSAQAEYMRYRSSAEGGAPDAGYAGHYAMVSYFLTGETRPYKQGVFGRVKPKSNFDGKGGVGAWEVALRYSNLDLSDSDIDGGKMSSWTLGVNWYLNPNARIMINYAMADTKDLGDVNTLMLRFQIDF